MTVKTNAHEVAAAMRTAGEDAVRAADAASRAFGAKAQAMVRSNLRSSGLDLEAGSDLVDSVQLVPFAGKRYVGFQVGSKRDEAHRLEVGFVGVDTEGRHVDAPPFPAYLPMVQQLQDDYVSAISAAVDRALRP